MNRLPGNSRSETPPKDFPRKRPDHPFHRAFRLLQSSGGHEPLSITVCFAESLRHETSTGFFMPLQDKRREPFFYCGINPL
jgi:hypothetical protein